MAVGVQCFPAVYTDAWLTAACPARSVKDARGRCLPSKRLEEARAGVWTCMDHFRQEEQRTLSPLGVGGTEVTAEESELFPQG